jgi:hypothetical protein
MTLSISQRHHHIRFVLAIQRNDAQCFSISLQRHHTHLVLPVRKKVAQCFNMMFHPVFTSTAAGENVTRKGGITIFNHDSSLNTQYSN